MKFNTFHKQIIRLLTIRFLFKIHSNLLADEKYLHLLTFFAFIKYYLIAIANIILKKTGSFFKLKKSLFLKAESILL